MDDLVALLDTLPPLPESSARLEELLADPNSTAREITSLVGQDAALATHVLRLANSAYYAIAGGVDSLNRAISCLGFSAIHQIVLCQQTQRLLHGTGNPIPRELMMHGKATAALCAHASTKACVPAGSGAYVAGLLHDMGRMAVAAVAPAKLAKYQAAVAAGAAHSLSLEKEIFGLDHQEAGGRLAVKWRFPEHLRRAVSDHHGPGAPALDRLQEQQRVLADLVAVADAWSSQVGFGGFAQAGSMPVDPVRAGRVGLVLELSQEERTELKSKIDTNDDQWD